MISEQQHVQNYLNRLQILLEGTEKDGTDTHTAGHEYGGGSAVEVESGEFLCALVKRFNPITVIETGTHRGFSSGWIATALAWHEESYPRSRKLITVDVNNYERRGESLWERLVVSHLVQRVIGDAREPETIQRAMEHMAGPVDFAWIDDDHGTDTVLREWNQWSPLFNNRNCIVVFHDTRLDPREGVAVKCIYDHLMYDLFPNSYPVPEVPEGCEKPRPTPHTHVALLPLRNMRGLDVLYLSNDPL